MRMYNEIANVVLCSIKKNNSLISKQKVCGKGATAL